MFVRKKNAQLCLDTIIVASKSCNIKNIVITICVIHRLGKYSINIDNIYYNTVRLLNINKYLPIDDDLQDTHLIIQMYRRDLLILDEKIDYSNNIIGALKSEGKIQVTLLFRVINQFEDNIVIHNQRMYRVDDFKLIKNIGRGKYGEIILVQNKSDMLFALKVFFNRVNIRNRDNVIIREIIPLIAIPRHPCLIKLEGFIDDNKYGLILVLEYASQGRIDTFNLIKISEDKKIKILYGLFSCIALLHSHCIVYRDIHPSNVLLSEDTEVKLVDFGVSRFYAEKMTNNVGHIDYRAPEIIDSLIYDELVDEYSLGVLLCYFDQCNVLVRLMKELLTQERLKRITCSEVCTFIECGIGIKVFEESEQYIRNLSEFHESVPPRDEIIFQCFLFFFENNIVDLYCDFSKLIDNIGYEDGDEIYKFIDLYYEGVSQTTSFYPKTNEESNELFNYSDSFPKPSEAKIEALFSCYIDYYGDISANFLIFLQFHDSSFSYKYFLSIPENKLNNCFIQLMHMVKDEVNLLSIVKSLNRRAKEENKPYILIMFFNAAGFIFKTWNKIHLVPMEYAAELGSLDANEFLAKFYFDNKCNGKAKKYAKFAYKNGRFNNGCTLATMYIQEKEYFKALEVLNSLVEQSCSNAMFMLGQLYMNGIAVEKDLQRGIKYFKMSADEGNYMAQYFLGKMYFHGYLLPKDFEQAFWYNSISLHQSNIGYFMHRIFLFFGIAVKQNFKEAKRIFERSYETYEIGKAREYLGIIYFLGLGVDVDIDKAREYCHEIEQTFSYSKLDDTYSVVKDGFCMKFNRQEYASQVLERMKNDFIEWNDAEYTIKNCLPRYI